MSQPSAMVGWMARKGCPSFLAKLVGGSKGRLERAAPYYNTYGGGSTDIRLRLWLGGWLARAVLLSLPYFVNLSRGNFPLVAMDALL